MPDISCNSLRQHVKRVSPRPYLIWWKFLLILHASKISFGNTPKHNFTKSIKSNIIFALQLILKIIELNILTGVQEETWTMSMNAQRMGRLRPILRPVLVWKFLSITMISLTWPRRNLTCVKTLSVWDPSRVIQVVAKRNLVLEIMLGPVLCRTLCQNPELCLATRCPLPYPWKFMPGNLQKRLWTLCTFQF